MPHVVLYVDGGFVYIRQYYVTHWIVLHLLSFVFVLKITLCRIAGKDLRCQVKEPCTGIPGSNKYKYLFHQIVSQYLIKK